MWVDMAALDGRNGAERPLKSWKEIASFFGRDERTVKRWEAGRGLPVHRVPGQTRASVYAYPSELEAWLTGNRDAGEAAEAPVDDPADVPPAADERPGAGAWAPVLRRRGLLAGIGVLAVLAAVYATPPMVRGYLGPRPEPGTERLSSDEEARDLYLSGNYQLGLRTGDSLNRAVQLFTQAIARDPEFAAAYAGLAKAYNLLSQYTDMPPESAYPLAEAAGERALKLDQDLAAAHAALGFTTFYWDRDFVRSRAFFDRALELDPGSADNNHWLALTSMQTGAFDVALAAIRRAQERDPNSRAILANKALILYHAGQTEEAGKLLREFSESAPDYPAPHFYLADVYFDQGRYREAIAEALEAAQIVEDEGMAKVYRAARQGYVARGREGLLEAMLAEQLRRHAEGKVPAYKVARTLAFLGRTEPALTYLALAVAEREPDSLGIKIDSAFRDLHGDHGFREILAQAGHTMSFSGEAIDTAADAVRSATEAPR